MDEKKPPPGFPDGGFLVSGPGLECQRSDQPGLSARSSLAESPIREFRIQMQQQQKRAKEIIGAARRLPDSGGCGVSTRRNTAVNRPEVVSAISANVPDMVTQPEFRRLPCRPSA